LAGIFFCDIVIDTMNTDFSYKFYNTTQQAWDAMYDSMSKAQKSIYWEVYILHDDKAGNRFIDLLSAKAKQGVEVKLILDSMGSFYLSSVSEARLKGAGVKIIWFNKLRPTANLKDWFRRVSKRNHRKILIIDESVGYVGGVNVYIQSEDWDDLVVRLEGRVVRSLLYGFAKSYVKSGGNKKDVKEYLHPKIAKLNEPIENIKFILHSPSQKIKRSTLRQMYINALKTAKQTFTIVSPYYVPDKKFLQMITQASRRGVKVNILLPARPDHRIMQYIARAFYELTVRAGASIYLLKNMNHAKAYSVDNKFGSVGSGNINSRSFYIDEESGVQFSQADMVGELNTILNDWQDKGVLLNDIGKKERGWKKRLKKWWVKFLKDYV